MNERALIVITIMLIATFGTAIALGLLIVRHLEPEPKSGDYGSCLAEHARLLDRSVAITDTNPAYEQFDNGGTHPGNTSSALTAIALFAPAPCTRSQPAPSVAPNPQAMAECVHTQLQVWHRLYQGRGPTTDAMLFARTRYVATICVPQID